MMIQTNLRRIDSTTNYWKMMILKNYYLRSWMTNWRILRS
jgi:hypothetical protein